MKTIFYEYQKMIKKKMKQTKLLNNYQQLKKNLKRKDSNTK